MARLTTTERSNLAPSTFAGPNRSFPIPDPNHAKAALSLVGRAEAAGHLTPSQAQHVRNVAEAKLHGRRKALASALMKP